MIHNLDGRFLVTFLTVVEEKSFNKASERLGYAQSTISTHIATLENIVDKKLFDRFSDGVVLTAAGERLVKYAYRFQELAEEMENELESLERPKGIVKICALETFHATRMPFIIKQFAEIYPDIAFYLDAGFLYEITMQVVRKKVDFGIVPQDPKSKEIDFIPLYIEELVFVASQEYLDKWNANFSKSHQVQFIGYGRHCVFGDFAKQALSEAGIREKERMEFSSTDAIKKIVASGIGIALLQRCSVAQELETGHLVVIPFLPVIPLQTGVIKLKGRELSRPAQLAKEFLVKVLQSG